MLQLYEEYYWKAKIKWSKPRNYEKVKKYGSKYDETAYFYKITGKYLNNVSKLLYLGKTYDQCVSLRLNQKDHIQRYKRISKEFPKHQLFLSFGELFLEDGLKTKKRIDEIESLLIYAHDSEYLYNKRKLVSFKVLSYYKITNNGYRSPLFKEICFGLTVM